MGKDKMQGTDAKGRQVLSKMVKTQNKLREAGGPTLSRHVTDAVIKANVRNVKR